MLLGICKIGKTKQPFACVIEKNPDERDGLHEVDPQQPLGVFWGD
jgi:hypothetical protein